jgi:hypothetical protein
VPDILALAPLVACPVLYVRGSLEPVEVYPPKLLPNALAAGATS